MINTPHSPPFHSQTVLFQKINYMVTLRWMIWQCQVSLFYVTRKMCLHLHKKAGIDTFPPQGLERGKGSQKERQESPVSLLHRCWESQAGKNWKHFTTSRRAVGRFWNHTKLVQVGAPRATLTGLDSELPCAYGTCKLKGQIPLPREMEGSPRFSGLLEWSRNPKSEPTSQKTSCQCWGGVLKPV